MTAAGTVKLSGYAAGGQYEIWEPAPGWPGKCIEADAADWRYLRRFKPARSWLAPDATCIYYTFFADDSVVRELLGGIEALWPRP